MSQPNEIQIIMDTLQKQIKTMKSKVDGLADANRMMIECLDRIANGRSYNAREDARKTILSLVMVSA